MKNTVIVSGSGGQGVMAVGMSLASSAIGGGKHASFMPVYGPEQRGGSARCTVIISDDKIISPLPKLCDVLIAMNDASFKKFIGMLKPNGLLILNSNRAVAELKRTDVRVIEVPSDDLAEEIGSQKIANIIMIGAMLGASDMIPQEAFMAELKEKFGEKGDKVIAMNRAALDKGVEIGKAFA